MLEAAHEPKLDVLVGTIREAAAASRALRIRGQGSKDFYGERGPGEALSLAAYAGIIDYDPGELMITARAGTTLQEIEQVLHESGQFLPFEPPRFGDASLGGGTLGGCIASGLSGPGRPYHGSVRDFVLGVRLIDGQGQDLRFGGRVMKNVAGYDVSRLMAGSLGALGVIAEVSLKVLPAKPVMTLRFEGDEVAALDAINGWMARGLPITATCHCDGTFHVRFSTSEPALRRLRETLGGELVAEEAFWHSVRDHTADFFTRTNTLWRVSVPANAAPLQSSVPQWVEWGGALRWLAGEVDAASLRSQVEQLGGHATLFRGSAPGVPVFHPLKPALVDLHRALKRTFDPAGIFNPQHGGR